MTEKKPDEKTSKLIFDIAYKELEFERNRATNLETKALRYITLGGILFSILTTYFLFSSASEFMDMISKSFNWYKLLFLISYISFIISWIPLVVCMRTYTSRTFDIAKLINEYKNDKLLIFGKGPEQKFISNFIIKNKLTKNIILKGFEQKKERIYYNIDVLIHPTFGEGCPNTILESSLTKTFIIASNVSGI
ncbi:hypothetical protein LCGC14_3046110, partial [marine sediment metagenome]